MIVTFSVFQKIVEGYEILAVLKLGRIFLHFTKYILHACYGGVSAILLGGTLHRC